MAFMQTKSCCCGCDLRTGTSILVILIAILNGIFFYSSVSSPSVRLDESYNWNTGRRPFEVTPHKEYSSMAIVIELIVFAICAMAGYSMQKNQRMFLIPFMLVIIAIFIVMLVLSLALLLAVVGIGSMMDSIGKNVIPDVLNDAINQNRGQQKNNSHVDFNVSIGTGTIVTLVICLINIAIFLHFVKVVCSLYAEMGKPNGVILPQVASQMASQMASPMYYPTFQPTQ